MAKVVVASVPVITGFVLFDDWYARQVRLEITPYKVEVDRNLMERFMFEIDVGDLPLIREIEDLDTTDYFEIGLMQARLSGMMGGDPENMTKYNLRGLNVAAQFMQLRHQSDSQIVRLRGRKPVEYVDSVEAVLQIRAEIIPRLENMIEKYTAELESKKRLAVSTSVLNRSGVKASLVGPAILTVTFEGETIIVPVTISSQSMTMDLMGMKVSGFGESSIDERSHEDVRFYTETAEDIGKNWAKLIKALEQAGAAARILCYASDGSMLKSDSFPFSEDYADSRDRERREALERAL